MRAVLLLAAVAAAEKRSWFGASQKKEKPVTREGRAVQLARKVLEARTLEDATLARAAAQLLQTPSKSPPVNKRCSLPSLSRRDARGLPARRGVGIRETAHETALERGGFLCRALLVLEAAHHRGPASSKRDAHLGAIDAACAFDAKTWRPPPCRPACQKDSRGHPPQRPGHQLFQWAFGKLVALDAGAAFMAGQDAGR